MIKFPPVQTGQRVCRAAVGQLSHAQRVSSDVESSRQRAFALLSRITKNFQGLSRVGDDVNAQEAGGTDGRPESARMRLAGCLQALLEETRRACGRRITLEELATKLGTSTSTISNWLNGTAAPSQHGVVKYQRLVAYLEECAQRPAHPHREWQRLIKEAVGESRSNRGGRPPSATRPAKIAPFRYLHTAEQYRPPELVGRREHLDRLPELICGAKGYLSLVAPAWAGKSAFLAAFVATYEADDMDLIAYFVRWGHGTDNAGNFRKIMIEQLSRHARNRPSNATDEATLLTLYKEASQKSVALGRRLLLVIDGLDEDAGECRRRQSIASLLPQQPYPGLRVLVSRRWHPPLPGDVRQDHPLRHAEQIPRFRPSPEAGVLRQTANDDLAALFEDTRGWVRDFLGYLALADGGLSVAELDELLQYSGHTTELMPADLERLRHSVAGRVFRPEDLEPDTLVLAHKELYAATEEGMGPRKLAELTRHLHAWADRYRAAGWPDPTPAYLLHHYPELLWEGDDLDRCRAFALDHRRLLCLANRGRTDLALASLDRVMRALPTPTVLAPAAASRTLLDTRSRPVPREVLRALVVVGDLTRAWSLALSAVDPASKAVRLIEVVRAALSMGPLQAAAAERARHLASEAATWATHAQRQEAETAPTAELEIQALVPRAAATLAAAGSPGEAVRLLATVDICRPENVAAVTETAALLLVSEPAVAAELLDELLLEAESHADSAEGRPDFAVEIWSAVATADPSRAESVHRRMKEFAESVALAAPDLTAVDCCALTASALAEAMLEEARQLAYTAMREAERASGDVPEGRLRESISRVTQALLDVGETPRKVRALLPDAPTDDTSCASQSLDGRLDDESATREAAEAAEYEELLKEMTRLSDLGDGPHLRQCLNRYTRRAADGGTPVTWLPFLAEALFGVLEPFEEVTSLLRTELSDTLLCLQILTSAAMAHADAQRHVEALRCAEGAADMVRRMSDPLQPKIRALVAQAFAHAGDSQRAEQWAAPPHGGKPLGRAGIPYRRAALAVEMGLEPEAVAARAIAGGLPRAGLDTSGTALLKALCDHAAGARTDAQLASLEAAAHARLGTEPLFATGLALLRATHGDVKRTYRTIGRLHDPAARGVAQSVVAAHLAGVPPYLDVAADEGYWTLSVLRALAHHMRPAEADDTTNVRSLVLEALATDSWYWTLPVLGRTAPDAVSQVAGVLDQHRMARRTGP
ncbi:helix-turn-helix domain-containing protein [Streptomyces sp. NPDC017529]|uniref:helix-turn-helix domain-containing protein n=1 Tax=Streptomyces sp. NPDC017529 TaxID=3365000 RepID=UPI0037BC5293